MLAKQKQSLDSGNDSIDYSDEFYSLIPHFKSKPSINSKRNLSEKFEICQLLRDIMNTNESTNWNLRASIESKYRAIGSFIQKLNENSSSFLSIKQDIENSETRVLNIYEVLRPNEHLNYVNSLKNQKRLYHGSKINNYLGILSRGLLLPKCITNEYGDEIRSDVGLLGQGIYFSDSSTLSIKYTTPSQATNTRLLAVCDVALGDQKDYYDYDVSLVRPPDGYQSVRGVKSSDETQSKFNENEYVIYDSKQYKLRYLVEFESKPFKEKKAIQIMNPIETNSLKGINKMKTN